MTRRSTSTTDRTIEEKAYVGTATGVNEETGVDVLFRILPGPKRTKTIKIADIHGVQRFTLNMREIKRLRVALGSKEDES